MWQYTMHYMQHSTDEWEDRPSWYRLCTNVYTLYVHPVDINFQFLLFKQTTQFHYRTLLQIRMKERHTVCKGWWLVQLSKHKVTSQESYKVTVMTVHGNCPLSCLVMFLTLSICLIDRQQDYTKILEFQQNFVEGWEMGQNRTFETFVKIWT